MTIAQFIRDLEKVSRAVDTQLAVKRLTEVSDAVNKWVRLPSVPSDLQRALDGLTRTDAAAEALARVIEQQEAVVKYALATERAVQRLSFSAPSLPPTLLYPRIPQAPRRLEIRPVVSKRRTIVRPEVKRRIGFQDGRSELTLTVRRSRSRYASWTTTGRTAP